jgi:predicted MPP superfamily phosphohydrolase
MKKRLLALFLALLTLLLCACGGSDGQSVVTEPHEHVFDQRNTDEKYLRSLATCKSTNRYYLSCTCGEKGTATFGDGEKLPHDFTDKKEGKSTFAYDATCTRGALYYLSCSTCGKASDILTFEAGAPKPHNYSVSRPDGRYIKTEATASAPATYYKSCACGDKGTEVFTYGEALRTYTEAEKAALAPESVTVTLYDSKELIYGFTCNSAGQPLRPVIELTGGGKTISAPAKVDKYTSYDNGDKVVTYYVMKFEVKLEPNTEYTYRIYDKYAQTEGISDSIKTVNTEAESFTFVHIGDTQTSGGVGGTIFGKLLDDILIKNDFIVHTGDFVEWSKYEYEWRAMLHDNFGKVNKLPIMAVSGNHDTTYQNGKHETYKHFNYSIPEQDTEKGFFYSFEYGNAKFVMVNTNDLSGNKLRADQYGWLVNELASNTKDWLIVALHNPLYSPGPWGSDPKRNSITLALREQLADIFAEYGVDIVLQGHDHVVSRTAPIGKDGELLEETVKKENAADYVVDPKGVIYVMSGVAGNHYRSITEIDRHTYKILLNTDTQYWSEITVEGNRLTVVLKRMDGGKAVAFKKWGIEKTL